jgi:hypothetical protein
LLGPTTKGVPVTVPEEFTTDDGTTYRRIAVDEFLSFDEIDSRTVVTPQRRGSSVVTSQNGWPANDRSVIASYTIPGSTRKVALRKGDASVLLLDIAAWIHHNVEPVDDGQLDDWGYAERNIRGSSTTLSNHASGTAVDLNALKHPLGVRRSWTDAQASKIRDRLRLYGGVVRWGGDYDGRIDEMHFELNASPNAVAKVADRIRGGGGSPSKYPTIRRGDTGEAVKLIQRFLGVVGPGDPGYGTFGPKTLAAVVRYQRMRGLTPDGIVGPMTWAATGL